MNSEYRLISPFRRSSSRNSRQSSCRRRPMMKVGCWIELRSNYCLPSKTALFSCRAQDLLQGLHKRKTSSPQTIPKPTVRARDTSSTRDKCTKSFSTSEYFYCERSAKKKDGANAKAPYPACLLIVIIRLGMHCNGVRHKIDRVETDAKLTDEVHIGAFRESFNE